MSVNTPEAINDLLEVVAVSLFGVICLALFIAALWLLGAWLSKQEKGTRRKADDIQADKVQTGKSNRAVQQFWQTTMKLLGSALRYTFYAVVALALLAAIAGIVFAGYTYHQEIIAQLLRYQWYILLLAVGVVLCAAILPPRVRRVTRKGAWAVVGIILLVMIATHPFTHAVKNWMDRELRAFATELEKGYTVYDSFWVTVDKNWTTPIFNPPGRCTYVENADGLRLRGQIKSAHGAAWRPYERGSRWAYLRLRLAKQEPRTTGRVFFQIRVAGSCATPRH